MGRTGITLTRFIIETQAGYPAATGEFSATLMAINIVLGLALLFWYVRE